MRLLAIMILAASLVACSRKRQETTTTTQQQTTSTTSTDSLLNREWTLVTVNGQPVTLEKAPSLKLETEGNRASGFAGCNRFSGAFVVSGDSLHFEPLAMTRMACEKGMDVENAFANALQGTRSYRVANGSLDLFGETGVVAHLEAR